MEESKKKGLLEFVWGLGEKILQYMSSSQLVKTLEDISPREPNNIEQIAIGLAVGDPERITKQEMIVCIQIVEALKQHESKKTLIEGWATKARMSQQNPGSIEYLTNRNKTVTMKEIDKMEGIERESSATLAQNIGAKKRRQEDAPIESTSIRCQTIEEQRENSDIVAGPSKQDPKVEVHDDNIDSRETIEAESKGKKLKKNQDPLSEELTESFNRIQKESPNNDQPKVTLEDSFWAPQNRPCDRSSSFKAKIPTCKIPGDTKEYRMNYMKWVFRGNNHIKSIEEDFINRNSWIVVDFDCEHSRRTLSEWVMKKEGEWCKFIPEEDKNKRKIQVYRLPNGAQAEGSKPKEGKRVALKPQEAEFQQFLAKEVRPSNSYLKGKKKEEDLNYVTIWDLPTDIRHREIYDMCRKFNDVQIVKVKKTRFKALAVIETTSKWHKNMPWVLPYSNNKLARITPEDEDSKQKEENSLLKEKLKGIPK